MIFLDTHVVVWLYAGIVEKISKLAIQQIESNELLISQLVRLELQYLYEIGRITVAPDVMIKDLINTIGLKVSQMKAEQVFNYAIETAWARDVFGRLITAEADSLSLAIITKDKSIQENYRRAIW